MTAPAAGTPGREGGWGTVLGFHVTVLACSHELTRPDGYREVVG